MDYHGEHIFAFQGYDCLEKNVKQLGNSGGVSMPRSWIGGRVKIILTDLPGNDEEKKGSEKMEKTENSKVCENYVSGCKYLYPEMEIEEDKFGIRPKECPFKTLHCGWFP